MDGYLYLCHPCDVRVPGLPACVKTTLERVSKEPAWDSWKIECREYDKNCSLGIQKLCAEVISRSGPVLLLNPVQKKIFDEINKRLGGRVNVLLEDAYDEPRILESILRARQIHDSGEPHLARNLIVALLILRKLDQERMWAGNSKGYMWADLIPKGRGVKEEFADAVGHVINVLFQHDLLIYKTSKSSTKWACNPTRREEIYTALRDRAFTDGLHTVLARDAKVKSARELDLLDCYDRTGRNPGSNPEAG
jgi:hypothetical protein